MEKEFVFISYAREDRAFVDRLSEDLGLAGITTWQDTKEISPGENWREAIERSLRQASAMLFVSSARSSSSTWMMNELAAVFDRGTRIIPLIVDDQGEQELPVFLRAYQWVDFRSGYGEALAQLLAALKPFQAAQPVAPAKQKAKGYVFLSYAEEDSSFVDEAKEFLEQRKYGYWDYRESDRDYHQDLYLELESIIKEAVATISFLSPAWKLSRIAIKEYHFAVEVGIPVFLLRVRDPGPTLVIAGLPYIDFTVDHASGFKWLDKELIRKGL